MMIGQIMSRLSQIAAIGLLALFSAIVAAETPDECAARLDQSIAISSYDEAADWWARVERECAPQPETSSTTEPTEIPSYQGIYGWEGDFVFCVMAPTLNIRNTPAGTAIDRFDQGDHFTIDLASQTLAEGYVWAEHDKGWSALFRYPVTTGSIDEFTNPNVCPTPTPTPKPQQKATPTPPRAQRAAAQHDVIRIGQQNTFDLSGAECAITAQRGDTIDPGKLYIAVGRFGWVRDFVMVDLFAPGSRTALYFTETEVGGGDGDTYYHQLYVPQSTNEVMGFYTVDVHTYNESKKFSFNVSSKDTYNIAVACV